MNSEFTAYFTAQMADLSVEFQLQFQLQCKVQKLLSLSIDEKRSAKKQSKSLNFNNPAVDIILQQLMGYFSSVSPLQMTHLEPKGTLFQKSVWSELRKIPLGETRTYGEIAKKLNSSARAVGNACRKNPIQLIVPCHRVVSAKGLGGYAGQTQGTQLKIKRWLLNHEGVHL
jgi:methylated-DNA-[protein]-cysteine S-methyltransferase